MKRWDAFEGANNRLAAQINDIDPTFWGRLSQSDCDIDPDFLGFVYIYEQLAGIIPTGRTVIDLGCAYAPQAAYFMNHKRYIGIDLSDCPKLQTPNATYFTMPIRKWIDSHAADYRAGPTFAICSYVPPWCDDNRKLVREAFDSVFTFYPEGGDDPEIDAVFLKMRNTARHADFQSPAIRAISTAYLVQEWKTGDEISMGYVGNGKLLEVNYGH